MKKETHRRHFFIALGVFWALLGLSFAAISYVVAAENGAANAPLSFALNLFKFFFWFAFAPLVFVLVRRYGFDRADTFLVNFAVHVACGFVLSGAHTLVYTTLVVLTEGFQARTPTTATLFQEYFFFGNFFLNLLLYALIVIAVQAYLLYGKYLTEESRSAELRAELADARLQALKMQLNPHFLFNALHSISSLNLVEPQKANRMIARLGEFLRMTLESSDEQTVTLGEEIEYLRCYLEIEQIRFSDRLTAEFDVAPELLKAEVPHLILQPLVENAVKYGLAPFAAPGRIAIGAERKGGRLILRVADRCERTAGILSNGQPAGSGTGLQNVRSRLKFLYDRNFRLEINDDESGATVEIEIPFAADAGLQLETL